VLRIMEGAEWKIRGDCKKEMVCAVDRIRRNRTVTPRLGSHGQPSTRSGKSIVSWVNELLLGDEDSVEELSLVLASDFANLADASAAEGEIGIVLAFEDELVFDIGSESDSAAWLHNDNLVLLSAQEVLDADGGAVLGDDNVDWEMSMNESHFVAVTLQGENV
jgi:hypothetical protein